MKNYKKVLLFTLVALTLSCKKENGNRINSPSNLYINVVPHLDTASRAYTNSPINSVYKVSFDNYAEFENEIDGNVIRRGLIWGDTDGSISLDNGASDTSSTVVPTIISPYIPTATNLFRGSISSSPFYYFKYYAKLNNSDIVYSQATYYIHP